MSAIWRGVAIMLVTALTGAAATLGQGVCRALLSQGLAYDMRNKLFAHIQTFSFANLDKMQTGQLMTRLSSDVDQVRGFSSHGLSLLLRALLMLIGSVVMMFVIETRLALITLIVLPLAGFLIWGLMALARPIFIIVQEKLSALNTTVQENLAGVQVVKAFVRERFEIDRFIVSNDAYMRENIKVGKNDGRRDAGVDPAHQPGDCGFGLVWRPGCDWGPSDIGRVGRFQQLPDDWDGAADVVGQYPDDGLPG